ncbi:hypothetical protein JD77_01944 [Micromonospora olivasterospora]|uniref:Uncharacterized protein n=1 Tax=Micromonospora olivasterospora TaxID=1880 RepID=A0A562I8H2_MICOL|nr:hypothetical protein JD77_01944 [Micromonospora olivasterospora]
MSALSGTVGAGASGVVGVPRPGAGRGAWKTPTRPCPGVVASAGSRAASSNSSLEG